MALFGPTICFFVLVCMFFVQFGFGFGFGLGRESGFMMNE
jgi:hypothetical protein